MSIQILYIQLKRLSPESRIPTHKYIKKSESLCMRSIYDLRFCNIVVNIQAVCSKKMINSIRCCFMQYENYVCLIFSGMRKWGGFCRIIKIGGH